MLDQIINFSFALDVTQVGDVFTFISKIENMTFNESLEFLAERANIKLPENKNYEDPQTKLKEKMFAIYADSTLFYHERLYKPLAKIAQDYVRKRKLNSATLEQFKIGYSGETNELYGFLHNKGYSDKDIEMTELCVKGKDGKYYDFFRKRLMFPIMNVSGKVMAFGARKLEDDGNPRNPKYLNSRDSLIFKKRENLFALNFAKKEDINSLVLVEGNMDVISLHLRGIRTAVASLGTAFTSEQAKLIRKYTDKVIISYDSDSAGQKAILAADEILEKFGIEARVLQIDVPGVKDPDEYIIKYGAGRFKLLMENAISMVEYKVKVLKEKYNLEVAGDKIRFLREVSKIISKVESKIEREIYIDKTSKQYGISKEAIFGEINKILYKSRQDTKKVLERPLPNREKKQEIKVSSVEVEREKMILYFLIKNYDEIGEKLVSKVKIEDFRIEKYKKIYNKILELKNNGNNIYNGLTNTEDEEFQASLSEILFSEYEINSVEKFTEEIISNYDKNKLNARKDEILALLNDKNIDKEKMISLEEELNDIIKELAKAK